MKKKSNLPKIGNKTFRSQFEFDVYKQIKGALPRGARLSYEDTKIPYVVEKDYVPDFTITLKDGRTFWIEAKGLGRSFDYDARSKMESVKKQHPDKNIFMVFMADRKLAKNTKMKPSDWAKKNNYQYAINEVLKEWFE